MRPIHRTIAVIIGTIAAYVMLTATIVNYAQALTVVAGNPDCASLGIDGIQFKDDPPSLHLFDNGTIRIAYFDAFTVSGVLNLRPHDFDVEAIIVKGGPAATVATSVPAGGLTAPVLDNGNVPAISHVTVCLSPKEPEPTTTTTEPTTTTTDPKTTTTTEVPPSDTTTTTSPTSTTTTPSPPTTFSSTSTTSTTAPPPPTTNTPDPPNTTSTPTTTPTTTPSTPPPSTPIEDTPPPPFQTTPPPAEITEQSGERPPELPATGIGWQTAALVAAGLIVSGTFAIVTDRRRGGSWS